MVLKRPVKYNPDKRDFVLTETALSNFEKSQKAVSKGTSSLKDDFETRSELSKTES